MDTSTEGFRYKPLSEPDSIRLLVLEPSAQPEADLRGHLIHTTIRERGDDICTGYIAISYVWGDPTAKGSIILGGQPVSLTASLDAALRGIRDSSVTLRAWADAICIDQGNIAERNQQVSLMGSIYSLADHTVIFLGSITPDAELVLRSAARWHALSEGELIQATADAVSRTQDAILSRPWFTRTWILQELVLSRDPWVQCGRVRARWADLCSLLLAREARSARVLHAMQTTRSEFQQSSTTLLGLLSARRGSAATDPRDLVYGLLGMLPKTLRLPSDFVNYTLPVEQVYVKTARYILESGSWPSHPVRWQYGLQLLLSAADDGTPMDERPRRVPSWVPDWTLL
ncbi:heterokaryon incompatibility protein-domain-containing protein, partial [Achaetomium macrosporum]